MYILTVSWRDTLGEVGVLSGVSRVPYIPSADLLACAGDTLAGYARRGRRTIYILGRVCVLFFSLLHTISCTIYILTVSWRDTLGEIGVLSGVSRVPYIPSADLLACAGDTLAGYARRGSRTIYILERVCVLFF